MPIAGLTEVHRLSRTGKIRLGIKVKSAKGVEYPKATDYFVCPPEVQKVYGEKPRKLDIIIPVEDDEVWCNQYYRQYSRTRGLVCKGDGVTCRRMIDVGAANGSVATRETKEIAWVEGLPCAGKDCEYYQKKMCQETMNLQFFLPKVDGIGVWQIDTGSVHSIMFVNDAATTIRATCGKVAWIPLTLTLEPTDVNNPEDGKKKTVYCMHLRHESSLIQLMEASEKPRKELLIARPSDDEAPMDRQLTAGTPEAAEELEGAVIDDIDSLFGDTVPTAPQTGGNGQRQPPASATAQPGAQERGKNTTLAGIDKDIEYIIGGARTTNWKPTDIFTWATRQDALKGLPTKAPTLTDYLKLCSPDQLAVIRQAVNERAEASGG